MPGCKYPKIALSIGVLASATSGVLASATHPAWACDANALGVARTIEIGPQATELGLKTYPRTLQLNDKEVVLTFDDGPLPATTTKVLDALDAECVKATFFLIGRNAAAAPALVRREIEDGHSVGHHSFSHPSLTLRNMATDKAKADIDQGIAADDRAAYGVAGEGPKTPFFRFPGFADTPTLNAWLTQRGVTIFGADLWASDWTPMRPEAEMALLLGRLDKVGRGVILLHDSKQATAAMMPAFLRALKERNYKVVHIAPGQTPTPIAAAPAGWSSETERTLAHMWPKAPAKKPQPASAEPASPDAKPTPEESEPARGPL